MENQPYATPNTPTPSVPKKNNGRKLMIVLGVVVLFAGTAYGVFAWQQTKVKTLNQEKATLVSDLATAESNAAKHEESTTLTTTEPVVNKQTELEKTIRAYSVAKAIGFGGTAYTISNQKSVGDFTKVSLKYKEDQGSECCSLVFKNVESRWVLLTEIAFVAPEGDPERELEVTELNDLGIPKGQGLVAGW